MGEFAFHYCFHMTTIDFKEGLETIDDYAVDGWRRLERVTLPSTLQSHGEWFLREGGSFCWFVVPEGITKIPEQFMAHAQSALCVYVPANVKRIGADSFHKGLITIYTPEGSAAASWAETRGYRCVTCASPEDMPKPSYMVEGDFHYTIFDGGAIVLKYFGQSADVVIPVALGGYPVRAVQTEAFVNIKSMRRLL